MKKPARIIIAVPIFSKTERGIECVGFTLRNRNVTWSELFAMPWDKLIVAYFTTARASIVENLCLRAIEFDEYNSFFLLPQKRVIMSYEDKFLQDFKTWEEADELLAADEWCQNTASMDAWKQYLFSITYTRNPKMGKVVHDLMFPQIPDSVFSICQAAKAVCGSFLWTNAQGEYNDIFSYDRKRAFSYEGSKKLPMGNAETYKTPPPASRWWIALYTVSGSRLAAFDPLDLNAQIKKSLVKKIPFSVVLTPETLDIFNMFYAGKLHFRNAVAWKLGRSPLLPMFYNNLNNASGSPAVRKYAKARNNLLVGRFGSVPVSERRSSKKENESIKYSSTLTKKDEKAFFPVWLCIEGRQKLNLLRILKKFGTDIIYANTDGIFSRKPLNLAAFNTEANELCGAWDYKGVFRRIYIRGMSHYFGELIDVDGVLKTEVRSAGMIKGENINYEDYASGKAEFYAYNLNKYGFLTPVKISYEAQVQKKAPD